MTEKIAKPARKRVTSPRTDASAKRKVGDAEIAERAYFIYLDERRSDPLDNWLRAERELTAG
jgi:hypothetical protein